MNNNRDLPGDRKHVPKDGDRSRTPLAESRVIGRWVALLVLTLAAPVWGNDYTTVFSATESPLSEGGRWVNGGTTGGNWTNVITTSGFARGTQTGVSGYNDSLAVLTGTWGPNQTASATVRTQNQPSGNVFEEVELLLRFSITPGNARGYEVNFSVNKRYAQVVKWLGPLGSFSHVDSRSIGVLRTGDVVKATVTGNPPTFRLYINDVLQFTITDTQPNPYTTGNPGMGFYYQTDGSGGVVSDYGFTNYSATDGISGSPPAAPSNLQITP